MLQVDNRGENKSQKKSLRKLKLHLTSGEECINQSF